MIAITPEEIQPCEARWVTSLLSGPCEPPPPRPHRRLRLHGHFELAAQFNIGGLHLNRRCPSAPAFYSGPLSRSCHSIEEVIASTDCDYVTLSPIFDSVSKQGYKAAFSPEDLSRLDDVTAPQTIALGGITPERVPELSRYNFTGFAVKGAIDRFNENHI